MQKKKKKIPFHRTHTLVVATTPQKHRGPEAGICPSSGRSSERPVAGTISVHLGKQSLDGTSASNDPTLGMPSDSCWDWPRGS